MLRSRLRFRSTPLLFACGVCAVTAIRLCGSCSGESPLADRYPGAAEPRTPESVFGEMIRPTEHLAPPQQRERFHLPPGFEVRLFASEPQIAKPINIAVDDQDRLWVTQTTAYPHPAGEEEDDVADAVMILEDTDGDGFADRVTTFADRLNIPIGVLPYGNGCLCFSIPNIYYLQDTTGDGICDRREVILGPFDTTRDTHGMVNSLRDGGDGWIYACHGFNNRSRVSGTDGREVLLESGNTFRFRPDGSSVELYTRGQVNPFGLTRDGYGYWYSADCHSKPITQLIRGACYPSFGRPHDGLGFLPPTVDHLHGSTAISGILYIPQDSPIKPLRGQLLSGNVMTSRLNRNLLEYRGATARGIELPDFLTSDDPWFRPVDIQIDSQGHIYVADFYNKIIGHYEVPLEHPDRDRTSGRIWQIRYTGAPASDAEAESAAAAVTAKLAQLRQAAEQTQLSDDLQDTVRRALDDEPHVARAAAEALAAADTPTDDTLLLVRRLASVSGDDPVLRQSIRIAIRDRLARTDPDSPLWQQLFADAMPAALHHEAAAILPALDGSRVIRPTLDYLGRHPESPQRRELLRHAAAVSDDSATAPLVEAARALAGDSPQEQREMLDAFLDGVSPAALSKSEPLRQWGLALARRSLAQVQQTLDGERRWIGWKTDDGEPWGLQTRSFASGGRGPLHSSHTRGEQYTGTLISDPFPAADTIRFRIAGHSGHPEVEAHRDTHVRLIRVSDGEVLREVLPPRSDIAQEVRWDVKELAGKLVRIEVRDGDSAGAYAWIAVGDFDPAWLDGETLAGPIKDTLHYARRLALSELTEPLEELLHDPELSISLRIQAASAVAELSGRREWQALLEGSRIDPRRFDLMQGVLEYFPAAEVSGEDDAEALAAAFRSLVSHFHADVQLRFVRRWLADGASALLLLEMLEAGHLAVTVIGDDAVSESLRLRLSEAEQMRLAKLAAAAAEVAGDHDAAFAETVARVESASGDAEAGKQLFTKHCAACHEFRGSGSMVGPQLDGTVSRSSERLLEDILLPDRNVDAAFRMTSLLLDDGRVLAGVIQSENETVIRMADSAGKTIEVDPELVIRRVQSARSLMPGNFAEVLSAEELASLLRYLRQP